VKNPGAVKAFGTHLRQLREAKGLSQQELADASDITKMTVQRIENAKYASTIDVLVSLSKGLGITVSELTSFALPKEKRK
jgi:transcriptional regulator with XRE-family HTH domain